MSDTKEICRFDKNAMERLIFSLSQFKGRNYLDIRLWGKSDDGQKEFATKKGVAIAVNLFPQLKVAMAQAETFLVEQGLLNPEDLQGLEVG